MTDDVKTEAEDTRTPMQKAIDGGYKEPAEPTNEGRAVALCEAMMHAVKHNAPVTGHMLAELRHLLGVAEPDGEGA